MNKRLELHKVLSDIPNVNACYFSPPEGCSMIYPCIVYWLTDKDVSFSDNIAYMRKDRYTVTVIDTDPDSEIPDKVLDLPYSTSERNYAYEGLNHFVHIVYF